MDIVICNLPPMLTWYLPAAPAILTGACRWLGLSSTFIDFNITSDSTTWANTVCMQNPKVVALSIFSHKSRLLAVQLAKEIKEINPSIVIVAGGAGIKDSLNGQVLLPLDLIDYVIDGDGEQQWPELLVDQFGLNVPVNFDVMDIPYKPDYTDYNVAFYQQQAAENNQPIWIPVTGSRGCVRRCTFCDVHERWKFQQRDPNSIVSEIKGILEVFPSAHIHLTDSLVNGSLPAFTKMINGLIEVKLQYPNFTWGGQFIIRNKNQCDEHYWKSIAESGAQFLEIGVETGSDNLRKEMGKHFTNNDLDHSLFYIDKFDIKCVLMFFIGYPTETIDDYHQTIELLKKYKQYATRTIGRIQAGYSMGILPGTPLYKQSQSDPNMILTKHTNIWYNQNNRNLTFEERQRRRIEFSNTAQDLGYTMSHDDHDAIDDMQNIQKLYQTVISIIQK